MKFVLAEISRRNICFYYYDGVNGNRAFDPLGSGSIPLALAYQNNHFMIGQAAVFAKQEGCADAYLDLFDVIGSGAKCNDVPSSRFVMKVVNIFLEDMCRERFYVDFYGFSSSTTLLLLFRNDVSSKEIELFKSELSSPPFADIKCYDHSLESVKYFRNGIEYDWSGERDGMVVSSDNVDFSVKCYSLSDYRLKFEHRYKGQGADPRLDWAANLIWNDLCSNLTLYTKKEEALPVIKKEIVSFLASSKFTMRSVKLPSDGEVQVLLSKSAYYNYSPTGGNQFMTIANGVVSQTDLTYETTGIVLQQYAADNDFFRQSFIDFDPICDENDIVNKGIRNGLLREQLGLNEKLEVDTEIIECQFEGGTFKVGVTYLPVDSKFIVETFDNWIDHMVGSNRVMIDIAKNEGKESRQGFVKITSAFGRITKTITVRQSGKDSLPPQDPLEVTENSVTLPWIGGTHNVGVKTMPEDQPFTAVASDSWIKVAANLRDVAISADSNMGTEERDGVVTLTFKHITKTIEVNQLDKGNRKFKITSEIGTSGGLFKKTKTLKVKVEILDDKALPFDCVFTLSKTYSIMFKPESMYYEDCEPGARGELVFGPYTLPISALGNTDVIYAGIWPAREMPGNPLFKNNQLEIKL